jgi:hypothetical protein
MCAPNRSARAVPLFRPLRFVPVHWLLLAVTLAAAVPRLYLGATQFVEYDGYWHVFVAMQDNWRQFYQEYRTNFHPPLFYLLLKCSLWFGRTPLVYRAISLLSGTAAVFVVGKIAGRFSIFRYTSAIAALAYGLALPSILVSCEVRSYMLSVFFVLVSFYYFLDMLQESSQAPRKSRTLFAFAAVLAGYTHYGAFLYIAACVVVALFFDLFRFRRNLRAHLAPDGVSFAVIAAALAFVYWTHARLHSVPAVHLRSYYFQPGNQSLGAFLLRNTRELINSFSPLSVADGTPCFLLLIALLLAGASLVYLVWRSSEPGNVAAPVTVATSAALLCLMAAGGALGKYPYGGELRQQFFLFPFAILCACILFDRLIALAPPRVAMALTVSAIALIVFSWSFAFAQYPKSRTELGTVQMNRFRKDFPAPAAVYVDDFNLINFFTHYHDWRWQFVGRSAAVPNIDIYRVSRGTQTFRLLRDRARWNLDFQDPSLFSDLARSMQSEHLPSLDIFYMRQQPRMTAIQDEPALARGILASAGEQSLCVTKVMVEGLRVYVDLKTGKCDTSVESLMQCSRCDDTNWNIAYSGRWLRGEYEAAWNGTLTYTNDPAAVARFSFAGAGVEYIYTKAFNRGSAAIAIDGEPKGVIDLYSPSIEWQSSQVFSGLPPGPHTLEIRATGRHNPASTGSYIDVDALEAR